MQEQSPDPSIPQKPRPIWVAVGLWGLPNRAWAWVCFWIAIASALGCAGYGMSDPRYFWGLLMLFAAWWYYAAICWVDRYGQWS